MFYQKNKYKHFLYQILIIIAMTFQTIAQNPPIAKRISKELSIHGHVRVDDYFWLRERENPDVIKYLEDENAYTESVMSDYKGLRENLFNEIVARIKQSDQSVPYKSNGFFYYVRYEEKKEYPIYCRKKDNLDNTEEILLNVNEIAEGKSYCSVSGLSVSPDNTMLAYGVDYVSRRLYTIYFKNLITGQLFDIEIPNATGSTTWANDNKTVFYTLKDTTTLRSNKVIKHKLGQAIDTDQLIFEEKDETYSTGIYRTKSDQFLMLYSYCSTSHEYRYCSANNPEDEFAIIQPRESNLEYSVDHYQDHFYIVTNHNAQNFRLMKVPVGENGKDKWVEIIAHRPDVFIETIEIFKNYLVVEERKNGLIEICIIDWKSNKKHYLDFGEETYTAGISINPEFDNDFLRFSYSSLTTPSSTFDYYFETHKKELRKQQEVLGEFDNTNYESKRLYARASDGTKIPISLVYKKGIKLDGLNPTLLYAYGSYGHSIDPYFSSVRLSLLNRGFVYAIAHIRGGQEMGRQWYDNGKMLHKMNTFTDFISCAEYLIAQQYTSNNKLCIMGGSAGGLLMGTVINIRPDLFKAVVAAVPFVDVLSTMLDESIPLTTGEYNEWGNPNTKEYYDYMMTYSPYDNVKSQNYPSMLVTTGLHDSQVQYWEPAKWVAKLRKQKTENNTLLLFTEMNAGHSGASGRFEQYRETALQYAFLFKILEIKE